jgi:hypothetical protein
MVGIVVILYVTKHFTVAIGQMTLANVKGADLKPKTIKSDGYIEMQLAIVVRGL